MVVVSVLSAWTPEKRPDPEKHTAKFLIYDNRMNLIIAAAVLSGLGTLGAGWSGSRRRSIEYFLDHIHKRCWNKNGGKDHDYRVAFFVQQWHGKRLKCYARTDGHKTKRTWSCSPPDGKDADGVVGSVWHNGIVEEVEALPASPNETQLNDYLRRTFTDLKTYDALSWKGSSMLGVPISVAAGEVSGVLLVECRLPGSKISLKEFSRDAEVAGMIWEGRL